MEKIKAYILERAKEKSTITSVLTAVTGVIGVSIAPEQAEAISLAVIAILTAVGTFTKEAK